MTDERLAELERVARAAGGQPWAEPRADLGNIYTGQPSRAGVVIRLDADGDEAERAIFAHLEAANPATVLALVAEVRRLREGLERVSDGEGVIPYDGCSCQSIAAEVLAGPALATLVSAQPQFSCRMTGVE